MNWISVSDRLPEPYGHQRYLVTVRHKEPSYKGRLVSIAEYEARDESPYWAGDYDSGWTYVTHWMPLPEPPKEG